MDPFCIRHVAGSRNLVLSGETQHCPLSCYKNKKIERIHAPKWEVNQVSDVVAKIL